MFCSGIRLINVVDNINQQALEIYVYFPPQSEGSARQLIVERSPVSRRSNGWPWPLSFYFADR